MFVVLGDTGWTMVGVDVCTDPWVFILRVTLMAQLHVAARRHLQLSSPSMVGPVAGVAYHTIWC